MKVSQIHEIINNVTKEVLGQENILNEDLTNVVDVGNTVFNSDNVDNYVKSLVDHIGKVVFVDRPYSGLMSSVLMDGWEYGAVLEKISMAKLPEASENESWELQDGTSYDPNIFYQPKVKAKFFDKKVTFEIPMSFTERQVKSAFSGPEQLNGFMSMIYNSIDRSMTVKLDGLIQRTINNFIGTTIVNEYSDHTETGLKAKTGVRAVNLLKMYNDKYSTTLTKDEAITNPGFIRFASYIMGLYETRLESLSTLFNIGGNDRITPKDKLHCILLSDFKTGADVYLQSDTFHENYVALPNSDVTPYWQGSGKSFSFDDVSSINVKTADGDSVTVGGILGVMFDRDALGVTNMNRRVTNNYNPKAEFFNNYYKMDAGYFNDTDENFVVFFMA